ncbi:hypothetical protein J5N97_001857 [Dioscorea zingiberensis]|uniref:Helicase C-terminal domain-containing protein n=1 Tax=Dioscorea zingiberensis TaxID=325984 RepID=A0A9D5BVL1_9LILI|nr:hypothetical protein J5N97_001857 [Dioscorea zingiberensis]
MFGRNQVQEAGKTAAIVVGGAAGLCFLAICLLFAHSLRKGTDVILFETSLGPPDFYPQTPNCPEETFTREYLVWYKETVEGIEDFQEGSGAPIFLLTSQVGGLGLTLTKADRVIVVDSAWNPRELRTLHLQGTLGSELGKLINMKYMLLQYWDIFFVSGVLGLVLEEKSFLRA